MTYNEVLTAARGQMGPCKACPVCDGRACRNTVPGPGAKGVGDVAIRNYSAWQNVRVNMDTICESGEPDTTLEMFGHSYRIPVFAGPVGAMRCITAPSTPTWSTMIFWFPPATMPGSWLSPVTAPIPRLWWVPARQ